MSRCQRQQPGATRSPLVDLEAELRALDRKRLASKRAKGAPTRRFDSPTPIEAGLWSDLERSVWLERAE